jgi:hypothetical protein
MREPEWKTIMASSFFAGERQAVLRPGGEGGV